MSSMSMAVLPALAPTLASSCWRIAYLRLARITTITSRRSRAIDHSACGVYMPEPSACSATTRRPGAATAAPRAIGRPAPMAPPVFCSQSCGAACTVPG
ncbi:hypothetical protein D3C81_1726610 [compost metagenome]